VSFRTLLLSVAAMSAEPVPNKEFYSVRPARQRAPPTARCADKAAASSDGPAMTPGNAPRRAPILLPCAAKPAMNQAMQSPATDGGRQIPCLARQRLECKKRHLASARANPLVSDPIAEAPAPRGSTASVSRPPQAGWAGKGHRCGRGDPSASSRACDRRSPRRPREEAQRRGQVTPHGQQDIDDLAMLVDRPVETSPLPGPSRTFHRRTTGRRERGGMAGPSR